MRNAFGRYAIAAVNLSLGGPAVNTSYCDASQASMKAAVDKLVGDRIATVAAAGNSGKRDRMGDPACISSVVSVGATCDSKNSQCAGRDAVAKYSDRDDFLDIFAHGSLITSSVPGGGYASWHGTSMATPMVTGAMAALKSRNRSASVHAMEKALQATGKPVYDRAQLTSLGTSGPANRMWLERINVRNAVNSLGTYRRNMSFNFNTAGQVTRFWNRIGNWRQGIDESGGG